MAPTYPAFEKPAPTPLVEHDPDCHLVAIAATVEFPTQLTSRIPPATPAA